MRIYRVAVNGQSYYAKASRASVAVHRALDNFTDGQLDGATVTITRGELLKYAYRVVADVPCEPKGSHKRDFVSEPMKIKEIPDAIRMIKDTNPEYKFLGYKRVELSQ